MQTESLTPVVVVVDQPSSVAHHVGLGIVRSLGRLGIPVFIVALGLDTSAFLSRYCAGKFRCSSSLTKESVEELLEVGHKIGRCSVLIPTSDDLVVFLADNADNLREQFIFPSQNANIVRSLCNKKEMYYKAKAHGVPTAEIFFPQSREELLGFSDGLGFPVVLKRLFSGGSRARARWRKDCAEKVVVVNTEDELFKMYDALVDWGDPNVILQEYIPGGDETNWMFNGYFSESSDCLFGLTGKKIRSWPIHRGIATLGVCLKNRAVEQMAKDFMKAIGYRGIVDIDCRYDARDSRYKVLDVNPRVGTTFRLFVSDNGMDVVRAFYLDMTGRRVICGRIREGRKWVAENLDLQMAFAGMREGTLTLRHLVHSLYGVREAACFAIDDPLPLLHMAVRFFARTFSAPSRCVTAARRTK